MFDIFCSDQRTTFLSLVMESPAPVPTILVPVRTGLWPCLRVKGFTQGPLGSAPLPEGGLTYPVCRCLSMFTAMRNAGAGEGIGLRAGYKGTRWVQATAMASVHAVALALAVSFPSS
jgi:hypothetical protein